VADPCIARVLTVSGVSRTFAPTQRGRRAVILGSAAGPSTDADRRAPHARLGHGLRPFAVWAIPFGPSSRPSGRHTRALPENPRAASAHVLFRPYKRDSLHQQPRNGMTFPLVTISRRHAVRLDCGGAGRTASSVTTGHSCRHVLQNHARSTRPSARMVIGNKLTEAWHLGHCRGRVNRRGVGGM